MASVTEEQATKALATTLFDSVENNQIATVVDCFAPEAEIWHNTVEKILSRDQIWDILGGLHSRIYDMRYNDRRLNLFPGGFVHQHTIEGTRVSDEGKVRLPVCLICHFRIDEDGRPKITRAEEYFDSAHQATLFVGATAARKIPPTE